MDDVECFVCDDYLYTYEQYIYNQNINLLKKVSIKYNIDLDELINKFLNKPKKNNFKLQKTQKKCSLDNTERCDSRTWGYGQGTRCTRKRFNNSNYCKTHLDQFNGKGLTYGNYWENDLKHIFGKKRIIIKYNR